MSKLEIMGQTFDAFSGEPGYRNKSLFSCVKNLGAIPEGRYCIVDKPTGGGRGTKAINWGKKIWEQATNNPLDRDDWLGLFAMDRHIDDETFCAATQRGAFRLHPGTISKGCVTLPSLQDFRAVRQMLIGSGKMQIPDVGVEAYGILTVTANYSATPPEEIL